MKIEYEVNHQKCKRKDRNMIVNDSQNYLEIKFTFSEDWNNCTKFIFFRCNDINYPYGLINDKITVPAVFLKTESLTFGVYGINDDVVITTNLCKLRLGKSYYDSETSEVDETIYTETVVEEMFDAIDAKSPKGHTHTESDVIDLKDYVVKEEGKGLFSGSYDDLTNRPFIPEEVSDLTDGNDVVKKSSTAGLLKNDGTIDTNSYSQTEHNHIMNDITDLDIPSDVSELTDTQNTPFTPKSHVHTISDVTALQPTLSSKADKNTTYTKTEMDTALSNKADNSHTHSKSEITDFTHTHDERYYTKTEVHEIIEQTKHALLNRIGIICDKEIIQQNETVEINAFVLTNGVPLPNLKVEYYCEDA